MKAAEPIYYPVSVYKTVVAVGNLDATLYVLKVDGRTRHQSVYKQSTLLGEKNVCDRFTPGVKNRDGPYYLPAGSVTGRTTGRKYATLPAGHAIIHAIHVRSAAGRSTGPDPIGA